MKSILGVCQTDTCMAPDGTVCASHGTCTNGVCTCAGGRDPTKNCAACKSGYLARDGSCSVNESGHKQVTVFILFAVALVIAIIVTSAGIVVYLRRRRASKRRHAESAAPEKELVSDDDRGLLGSDSTVDFA